MKSFIILSGALVSVLLSSMPAMAQPDNQITWKVVNGLKWSNVLADKYDNVNLDGVEPINGIIQKSHATEACKAIGGELPTKASFDILEEDYGRFQIDGVPNTIFWTSNTNDTSREALTYRNGGAATVDRLFENAVICVEKNP